MRPRAGAERVTNVELFFDLVYVFAVTQISHYLLAHPTVTGALRAGLLLVMIWLVWADTAWVTNWLDPGRIAVRLLLLGLVGVSLVMSAALPGAFSGRGLAVGIAYAVMQVGRSVFAVVASWMILGGVGLFLAGHAAFKAVVWRATPWSRIVAVVVLALLGLAAPHVSALALSACAAAVVVGVAVADHEQDPGNERADARDDQPPG
jgi:low temperature requirement protein LtrA